jgi:hypothetical protein
MNYDINLYGGGVAALGVACGLPTVLGGPGGVIVAVGCGLGVLAYGTFLLNAVSHAAGDKGCRRIRYVPSNPLGGFGPLTFYDDHSAYCSG